MPIPCEGCLRSRLNPPENRARRHVIHGELAAKRRLQRSSLRSDCAKYRNLTRNRDDLGTRPAPQIAEVYRHRVPVTDAGRLDVSVDDLVSPVADGDRLFLFCRYFGEISPRRRAWTAIVANVEGGDPVSWIIQRDASDVRPRQQRTPGNAGEYDEASRSLRRPSANRR